jgi:hypothetical protein
MGVLGLRNSAQLAREVPRNAGSSNLLKKGSKLLKKSLERRNRTYKGVAHRGDEGGWKGIDGAISAHFYADVMAGCDGLDVMVSVDGFVGKIFCHYLSLGPN